MKTTTKKSTVRNSKVPTIADINRTLDSIAVEQKKFAAEQRKYEQKYAREAKKRAAETERLEQESKRMKQETERLEQETKRMKQETERIRQETERTFKKMFKEVGGISNNNGSFAEEYFTDAFEQDKTLGKIHFDDIQTNISVKNRDRGDEYDIVLYNDESVAIIEIKYKAKTRDIDDVVQKADSFRQWFPEYQDYNVYLGLAGLSFQKNVLLKAKDKGVAIIRQKGDKLVVNDKYLKAY